MATGDLRGNLRKIEQGLRILNYPRDVDYAALAKGDPSVFLPIISYCFTSFSTYVTELLVESEVELTAKNDLRFIEAVYKLLRDEFQYKPVLSKQQFLHCGFAERKIQVVCDIISLVYKRHKEIKSQGRKRAYCIRPQPQANCTNHLQQGISLTEKPGIQHSRSSIHSSVSEDMIRELSEEDKTQAVFMADGLGTSAVRSDSVCKQGASSTKKAEIERSRSLISACIPEEIVREVLQEEESKAFCMAYGLDSGADRVDSTCEQGISHTKKAEIERSKSLISACIPEDIVKEVMQEGESQALCMAHGLDSDAHRVNSTCKQDAWLTKKAEIERSRSLVSACIPKEIVREVLEEEKTNAHSVAYGLDSGVEKVDSVCEQDVKDKSEIEKLKSQISELEEKLIKLNHQVESRFQASEEKLQGKIIIDKKDWNNLLSRVVLLETQLLLHSKKVDLPTDLNNLGVASISPGNVTPVSPDRDKEDLPESLQQSSGYSSLLSAEPSPKATVINNCGLSEVSKDTTIQRMERISKMIEETSELLKTSSNTS